MKTLKEGDYVIAPIGCEDYLTTGKKYEVFNYRVSKERFNIIDDKGDTLFCIPKGCCHLNRKDWIIAEPKKSIGYTLRALLVTRLIISALRLCPKGEFKKQLATFLLNYGDKL